MANLEVWQNHLYTHNGSGNPGNNDGHTAVFAIALNSTGRPGVPPGTTPGSTAGSYIRTSTGATWYMRMYFRFNSTTPLTHNLSRFIDSHIPGGYPGFNASSAGSAFAIDFVRPGVDNNGATHVGPYIEMDSRGGGTWRSDDGLGPPYGPSHDGFYHGYSEHHFAYDITYDTDYYLDLQIVFSPDSTVGSVKADIAYAGTSHVWIPFQHIATYYPAGTESGGVTGFNGGATSDQMWFQQLSGGYEASSSTSNQEELISLQTILQAGTSQSAMISDAFTVSIVNGTFPTPGSGGTASSFVDNSTTVSDANFTSGGTGGGGSPAPPSSISEVIGQFQGTDGGLVSFATATGKTEAQIKALMETANPNHKYEIHTFTDGSKYAMCERTLAGTAPPANWWVASS